jgi:hypothetical protein
MSTIYTPPISITIPAGTSSGGADIDIVQNFYEVSTAAAGYSVGDIVQKLSFYSAGVPVSGTADVWINNSTGVVLGSPPSFNDIHPQKSSGLTKVDLESAVVITKEDETSPLFTHLGKNVDTAAPADATGSFSILSGLKRLILSVAELATKIPALVNGKLPVANEPQWVTTEYKLNSALMLIFEKEYNGSVYRQRNWTATTDAQGVTSYVAGEWA